MTRRNHRPTRGPDMNRSVLRGLQVAARLQCATCHGGLGTIERWYDDGPTWSLPVSTRTPTSSQRFRKPINEGAPPAGYAIDCDRCGPGWVDWSQVAGALGRYTVERRRQTIIVDRQQLPG